MNSSSEHSHVTESVNLGTFWPLMMLSLSLGTVLLWNVYTGVLEFYNSLRVRDQLEATASQAGVAEEKIKAMFIDLLARAANDAEVKAITDKYTVRFTAPAQPGAAAGPPVAAPAKAPAAPAKAPAAVTNVPPVKAP